jgi:uncharacterized membrane protein (UPF0136 family)
MMPFFLLTVRALHFSLLLAAGGLFNFLRSATAESVWVGFGAAALLSLCAVAMSDIRDEPELGEAGVKLAWGKCNKMLSLRAVG